LPNARTYIKNISDCHAESGLPVLPCVFSVVRGLKGTESRSFSEGETMKARTLIAAAALLGAAALPATASAWCGWGPGWGNGWGDDLWGDGWGDFDFHIGGGARGSGWGRGYGYRYPYWGYPGWGGYPAWGGYAPYWGVPYAAPAAPAAPESKPAK
jgi:hypothetical protein